MSGRGGPGSVAKRRRRTAADIQRAAGELLGLEDLLPGQRDAIASVVAGRDTLAVLPTGGGKSAVYQIAGALMPGSTVVISPLLVPA